MKTVNSKILGVEISSPEKIIFPKSKITKLDVVNYYFKIKDRIMPYVKNRILSVIRCHKTIKDECFFKKHPSYKSEIANTVVDGENEYFYIKTDKDLIMQAQLGTLEFHTQGASVKNIEKPNYMVFDLDPDEKLGIEKLRQGVIHLKSVLDELNLVSFLKTSGGKGYHVVVPLSCKSWQKFYDFSKQIATIMETKWKNLYTTNIRKTNRKGKIFIDYMRNDKGSTCVSPYSLRARENAPISMPISWKQLFSVKPSDITIKNYSTFIKKKDPWENFFEIKQNIK